MSARLSSLYEKYRESFPAEGQWMSDLQDSSGVCVCVCVWEGRGREGGGTGRRDGRREEGGVGNCFALNCIMIC